MNALCIPYINPSSPIARQISNSDTNIQLFPSLLLCTSSFVPSVLLQSRSMNKNLISLIVQSKVYCLTVLIFSSRSAIASAGITGKLAYYLIHLLLLQCFYLMQIPEGIFSII